MGVCLCLASAKPVALIPLLTRKIFLSLTNKGSLLTFLFLVIPFLLAAKNMTPTPLPEGPMIIITPNQGSPSAFELVRVTDDRVEVSKEGVRLQFSRQQIKQIRIPEAGDLVLESVKLLSQVEAEDLSTFESLASTLQGKIPGLANQASRYEWLIPDASPTLKAVRQAVADMRNTLQVTSKLQEIGTRTESMANGSIPLSATWEEQINLALSDTNNIPYMKIRKETLDRFLSIRRKIRLELTQANEEATARARNLLEDIQSELRAGTLTEAGSELLIKETRRYVERVLEPNERANLEVQLTKATQECQQWFFAQGVRKSTESVNAVFSTVKAEIAVSSPAVRLESVLPQIFQLRRMVAEIPECLTREALAGELHSLEATLRDLPPPPSVPVAAAGESQNPQSGDASESLDPEALANRVDNYLNILKTYSTDWRAWAGLCVFLFLLNLRRRRGRTLSLSLEGEDGKDSGGGNSTKRTQRRLARRPSASIVPRGRRSKAWIDELEDPLQHPSTPGDHVGVDPYGHIKKKRGNQR